jgi:NAD(P)-dependent dehydrogenase (short-subunit alcohol dehydrogenase family)
MAARLALLQAALAASTLATSTPLAGKVALVTGASRGIGRAIAVELGRAGAEVYVTGRTRRGGSERTADPRGDLSIERTAEEVASAGGVGHFICCDHSDDRSVRAAFERIAGEQSGALDILVNNAFSTERVSEGKGMRAPFWEQGAAMWDTVHNVGLRGHYICACEAVPLMMRRGGGLMVQVSSFGGTSYIFNVAYGVAKAALDRLTADMHVELKPHGISTVSLYPGVVQTEVNLALLRDGKWDAASGGGLELSKGETPTFTGRAVAALAASDPAYLRQVSGSVQVVAELARQLGFTDEGGRVPPSIRSLRFLLPTYVFPKMREEGVAVPEWVEERVPDVLLPWAVFSGGPPNS